MKIAVIWSAALVMACAAHDAELQRARSAASGQLDCGDGAPEARLVKEENGLREYEVGCDFSFVRINCNNQRQCFPVVPPRLRSFEPV